MSYKLASNIFGKKETDILRKLKRAWNVGVSTHALFTTVVTTFRWCKQPTFCMKVVF